MRARAAILVGVLVAAGLGACGDSSETDGGDRPLLPVGASSGGGGAGSSQAMTVAEDSAAGPERSLIAPARPIEYRLADGATAPATKASAYRIAPASGDLEAKVAKALGVDEDEGLIEVVSGAGWYFSRDPDGSVSSSVAVDSACASDGKCEEPPMPEPPPGVPSAEEAEARFRQILTDLGIDPAEGTFDVSGDDDRYQRQVAFTHTFDGIEVSGLESAVSFGENGRIEFAGGFLGRFEEVGEYPLVGLDEAFERYQEGSGTGVGEAESGSGSSGSGSSGGPGTGVAEPTGDPAPDEPTETTETTDPPEPEMIEITGAELVLEVVLPWCEGDTIYLVPAFKLLPEDRLGFTVPAVEDASTVQPDPDAEPEPCPEDEDPDDPVGRPEPAPMPPDAGSTEPAGPTQP